MSSIEEEAVARRKHREAWLAEHAAAVVTFAGVVLGALAIGCVLLMSILWVILPRPSGHRVTDARTDAQSVRSAVEMYLAVNPSAACPTMDELVSERWLSALTQTTDPWGNKFLVQCHGEDVDVTSSGPDGRMGTVDDVS